MPIFIFSPQMLVRCRARAWIFCRLHSLGQTGITAFFVDTRIFVAWALPSMPTWRHCPRQGTPNPDWLLGKSEINAIKRISRLAIHLLFHNLQVRKSTGKWGERRGSR
jgi:hypothetical protein